MAEILKQDISFYTEWHKFSGSQQKVQEQQNIKIKSVLATSVFISGSDKNSLLHENSITTNPV